MQLPSAIRIPSNARTLLFPSDTNTIVALHSKSPNCFILRCTHRTHFTRIEFNQECLALKASATMRTEMHSYNSDLIYGTPYSTGTCFKTPSGHPSFTRKSPSQLSNLSFLALLLIQYYNRQASFLSWHRVGLFYVLCRSMKWNRIRGRVFCGI